MGTSYEFGRFGIHEINDIDSVVFNNDMSIKIGPKVFVADEE
jgi:hypothetical protein